MGISWVFWKVRRVVYRGGNANNGSADGMGYVNVNNGLTNSNVNISGRLYISISFFQKRKKQYFTGRLMTEEKRSMVKNSKKAFGRFRKKPKTVFVGGRI